MKAYIFLDMAPGHQEEIEKAIPEGVKEFHKLSGEYDAVVEVEADPKKVREIVDKIRKSGLVEKTVTFISWE